MATPQPEDGGAPVVSGGATRKAGQDFERAASLDQAAADGCGPRAGSAHRVRRVVGMSRRLAPVRWLMTSRDLCCPPACPHDPIVFRAAAGLPPPPLPVACPWCAAAPGVQCHVVGPGRRPLTHRPDRCHPSRADVAA